MQTSPCISYVRGIVHDRLGTHYSRLQNTGQEFDGSDSGARPDEAVSWGKIRAGAESVKVSISFPCPRTDTDPVTGLRRRNACFSVACRGDIRSGQRARPGIIGSWIRIYIVCGRQLRAPVNVKLGLYVAMYSKGRITPTAGSRTCVHSTSCEFVQKCEPASKQFLGVNLSHLFERSNLRTQMWRDSHDT